MLWIQHRHRWLWMCVHFRLSMITTLWSITGCWMSGEMLFLLREYLLKWNQQQRETCLNWTQKCPQQVEKWPIFAVRFLMWPDQLVRRRWAVKHMLVYIGADLLTQYSDIAWNLLFCLACPLLITRFFSNASLCRILISLLVTYHERRSCQLSLEDCLKINCKF
jgi:hypothetical protein